eukprot:4657837-Lingulodinium_polyedra.AAC.1
MLGARGRLRRLRTWRRSPRPAAIQGQAGRLCSFRTRPPRSGQSQAWRRQPPRAPGAGGRPAH